MSNCMGWQRLRFKIVFTENIIFKNDSKTVLSIEIILHGSKSFKK